MNLYPAITFLLLGAAASGVAAQTQAIESPNIHPLNLSVRKHVVPPAEPAAVISANGTSTGAQGATDTANKGADETPTSMRYGSGYESRTQGAATGEGGTSAKGGAEGSSGKGEGKGGGEGGGRGGGEGGGRGGGEGGGRGGGEGGGRGG